CEGHSPKGGCPSHHSSPPRSAASGRFEDDRSEDPAVGFCGLWALWGPLMWRAGATGGEMAELVAAISGRLEADFGVREVSRGGRDHDAASRQRRSDLARPAPAADTTVELRDHRARIVVSALHRCVEFLPPQTGLPWPTCRRRLGHRVLCCRGETTTGWALRLPLPAGSAEEDLRLCPAVQRH